MAITFRATGREILEMNLVRPLIIGLYAWADTDEQQRVEEAGSGIMVAAGLALTAKHVTNSFSKLDPQVEALMRRVTLLHPQYQPLKVKSQAAMLAYQEPVGDEPVRWRLSATWESHDTDVTAICVEPTTTQEEIALERGFTYLPWQLLPPRVGSKLRVFSCPNPTVEVQGDRHSGNLLLQVDFVRVEEHYCTIRGHGFCAFPGFRVNRHLEHGSSGGAVVHDGKLVGIFSGPDYVTSLWPLALMTYVDSADVEHSFADHFDSGRIRAVDWMVIKGNVERQECEIALEGSSVESRCNKKHVVLVAR